MMHIMTIAFLVVSSTAVLSYELTDGQEDCARNTFDKPCVKQCTIQFEKNVNGNDPDQCCEMTRCVKCWSTRATDACGPEVEKVVNISMLLMEAAFKMNNCSESRRYPSFKCTLCFRLPNQA